MPKITGLTKTWRDDGKDDEWESDPSVRVATMDRLPTTRTDWPLSVTRHPSRRPDKRLNSVRFIILY